MIVFTIDGLRLINLSNSRMFWRKKAEIERNARFIGRSRMAHALHVQTIAICPPLDILIVRIGPGTMDSDNLAISGKNLRDGIADALGIDDGSPLLTWRYEQEKPAKGAKHRYGVRVVIRERTRGEERVAS